MSSFSFFCQSCRDSWLRWINTNETSRQFWVVILYKEWKKSLWQWSLVLVTDHHLTIVMSQHGWASCLVCEWYFESTLEFLDVCCSGPWWQININSWQLWWVNTDDTSCLVCEWYFESTLEFLGVDLLVHMEWYAAPSHCIVHAVDWFTLNLCSITVSTILLFLIDWCTTPPTVERFTLSLYRIMVSTICSEPWWQFGSWLRWVNTDKTSLICEWYFASSVITARIMNFCCCWVRKNS
jgi:hypothetical protein